mgnify:FL=1|jgi:hypothetical protein
MVRGADELASDIGCKIGKEGIGSHDLLSTLDGKLSTAEAVGTAPEPPIMSRSVPVNRLVGKNETSPFAKMPFYSLGTVLQIQEFGVFETF